MICKGMLNVLTWDNDIGLGYLSISAIESLMMQLSPCGYFVSTALGTIGKLQDQTKIKKLGKMPNS